MQGRIFGEFLENFNKPKLVYAELARTGNAFLIDTNNFLVGNTAYILTTASPNCNQSILEWLLHILNSRITLFYLDLISSRFDENGWRWLRQFVEHIPILSFKPECYSLSNDFDSTNMELSRDKIEKEIAQLYGLTAKELAYICEKLRCY